MQELDIQLTRLMQQYSEDVSAEIRGSLTSIGKQAVSMLKATSPRYTGEYAKRWRMKTAEESGVFSLTIYQPGERAYITHLLERGHKTRNRRHFVDAQPHIQPVREWVDAEALKAIEKAVSES